MRTLLTGALLLLATLPLGAQADPAARPDSLLERERRRIRGEAASREPEREPAKVETPGLGWRSRVGIGVGVASPSTWLEEAGGLSVASDIAPTVAVDFRFPRAGGMGYVLGVRASRPGVTLDADASYDGGSVTLLDLFVGSTRAFGSRFSLRSGLVAVFVAGGDVAPFTEASRIAPGVDIGGILRLTRRVPASAVLGLQVLRYGGTGDAPTGAESGLVPRLMLELRHGY